MTLPFSTLWTDEAALRELGSRLAKHRLERGWSQARLAEEAGVSLRTVTRLESGASVQLENFVAALRVLRGLGALEALFPESEPSPVELARAQKPRRQRAPRAQAAAPPSAPRPWTWGDES